MQAAGPTLPLAPLTVFYGGTFDPVHCGHLAIARHARDYLGATVRLMPAADPPHRSVPGATASHRGRMLDLAVAGERGLVVDRREFDRDTPSYTVDTLHGIRRELGPAAPVALLVGADSLVDLPQWRHWQTLFELAHFVVAPRPDVDLTQAMTPVLREFLAGRWVESVAALQAAPGGRVLRLQQALRFESATEVRRRIAGAEPWRALVPGPVAAYIERHRLYGARGAARSPL